MKDTFGTLSPVTCFNFNGNTYLITSEEVDDDFRVAAWDSTRIRCVDLKSGDIKCFKKDMIVEPNSMKFVKVSRRA